MAKLSYDTIRLAIILGVVLPGIGHIYLGQIRRGVKIAVSLILSGVIIGSVFSSMGIFTNILSIIPVILWIWQIMDLRKIIKKLTGYSVEELEPPSLQVEGTNPSGEGICPSCRKSVSKESEICGNCGFKL